MTLRQQRMELAAEIPTLKPGEVAESLRGLQLAAMEELIGILEPVLPKRSVNLAALMALLD